MKKELLEYLIRSCVREVLTQKKLMEEFDDSSPENLSRERGHFDEPPEPLDSIEDSGCHMKELEDSVDELIEQIESETGDYENAYKKLIKIWDFIQENIDSARNKEQRIRLEQNYSSIISKILPFLSGGSDRGERPYVEEAVDEEPTKGAPAPPEGGQGTADQPEVPYEEPEIEDEPSKPETPSSAELKGIVLVNPRDKSKLQKIEIQKRNDAGIERELHTFAVTNGGATTKVALATMRAVKEVLKNPSTTIYLYFGKYDPESDEVFLMADKNLQIAKDSSISPAELGGFQTYTSNLQDPLSPQRTPQDFVSSLKAGGKTASVGIDEDLKKLIKKMVNEILDKK